METFTIDLSDLLESSGLPDISLYQYYKCLTENTVLINGDIDESMIESAIIPLERLDRDPDVNHITILLHTFGGDTRIGGAIIHTIEHLKTPTTLRIIGDADSMGTLIMMAKNPNVHKVCDPWSVGLIHAGSQSAAGDTNAVNDQIKFNQRYEKKFEEYILSHTSIDKKMYNKIKRVEQWLTAEDMLQYGIVDEIL